MSTIAAEALNQSTTAVQPPVETPASEGVIADSKGPQQTPIDDRVSSKLEMLMKREQSAIMRERLAKQKETEIEARIREIEEKNKKITEFESVKQNPKKALEVLGLSYDDLTKAILNDGELTPDIQVKKLEDRINEQEKAFQVEKERLAQEAKAKAEAEYERRTQAFKSEISQYVKDNAKRYEITLFEGQEEEIYKLIDLNYEKTRDEMAKQLELEGKDPKDASGKVMSIKEAADKIEEYLEKREMDRKKLDKVKAMWGNLPKEVQERVKQEAKKVESQKPAQTLTNQMSATPTASDVKKPITDEERIRRAVAYAKSLRPNL